MKSRVRKLRKIEKFHKNKHKIPKIIKKKVDNRETIYGARAINTYLPPFLKKPTEDYDIFTPKPKKDAREVERALDKSYGGNYFEVEAATHENTYRVRNRVTGKVVADYTKPTGKIDRVKKGKIHYVSKPWIKSQIKKTLKDPEAEFRHAKDRDSLNRLEISELPRKKQKRVGLFGF